VTTPAARRRRIGWAIGLAFASAVIGLVIGWIVAIQYEGEKTEAQRDQHQAERQTDAAKDSLDALCAAGYQSACDAAKSIGEVNDPEEQDFEIQEPEIQEPEIQEPEAPDPEQQELETQDAETQDAEQQEGEIQDPEIQDPEIQDEETQDPEVDDPDPNDPGDQITGGSCSFTGTGTIVFTVETTDGPKTFTCTGDGSASPVPTP
jgi:hypothetical protein